jgi:hypothetical protein
LSFPETIKECPLIVVTHHGGGTVLEQLFAPLKPMVKVIQQRRQQ